MVLELIMSFLAILSNYTFSCHCMKCTFTSVNQIENIAFYTQSISKGVGYLN